MEGSSTRTARTAMVRIPEFDSRPQRTPQNLAESSCAFAHGMLEDKNNHGRICFPGQLGLATSRSRIPTRVICAAARIAVSPEVALGSMPRT